MKAKGKRQRAKIKSASRALGSRAFASCLLLALCLLPLAFCPLPSAHAAWSKQKTGTFAWLHSVFFADERRGWAVGGKGVLLETTDGGASWEVRRPPVEDAMHDIFFTDERTGWIVCERSMFAPMKKDESVSYLLKTTDGGESWKRVDVTHGADVDVKLARLAFADAMHGWVFGEMGALFATSDGGATWERQAVPTRHLLLGASFADAGHGSLVGAGATTLYTADGGATWREGSIGELPPQFLTKRAEQAPSSVANGSPVASDASRVRARDGETAPDASPRLNAVSFADARHGWAVGSRGAVLSTSDGGRTWRAQASDTDSDLLDVKFFDAREGWAVGSDGTAIHTTDGGATWRTEPTGTPHPLEKIFFVGRARGWAVGFGGTVVAFNP